MLLFITLCIMCILMLILGSFSITLLKKVILHIIEPGIGVLEK